MSTKSMKLFPFETFYVYDTRYKIPSKYNSLRHHQLWIIWSIKQLSRHKQHLYNKAHHSSLADDWDTYKQFKHYAQRQCKDAYNDYVQGIVSIESIYIATIILPFIKTKRLDSTICSTLSIKQTMAQTTTKWQYNRYVNLSKVAYIV